MQGRFLTRTTAASYGHRHGYAHMRLAIRWQGVVHVETQHEDTHAAIGYRIGIELEDFERGYWLPQPHDREAGPGTVAGADSWLVKAFPQII